MRISTESREAEFVLRKQNLRSIAGKFVDTFYLIFVIVDY